VIIVDVLSFSTSVEIATSRDAMIFPVVFQIWTFSGICAMLMPSANGE
jgi:hypothetical protein